MDLSRLPSRRRSKRAPPMSDRGSPAFALASAPPASRPPAAAAPRFVPRFLPVIPPRLPMPQRRSVMLSDIDEMALAQSAIESYIEALNAVGLSLRVRRNFHDYAAIRR